jgi:hypothetical protein
MRHSKTIPWIFLLFLLCCFIGYLLAWKLPMDRDYSSHYDMVNALAIRFGVASVIGGFLFLLCGVVNGLIGRFLR